MFVGLVNRGNGYKVYEIIFPGPILCLEVTLDLIRGVPNARFHCINILSTLNGQVKGKFGHVVHIHVCRFP